MKTELGVQDCEGFSCLLTHIEDPIEMAIGDGAYDRFSCYEAIERRGSIENFSSSTHCRTYSKERSRADGRKRPAKGIQTPQKIEAVVLRKRKWKP